MYLNKENLLVRELMDDMVEKNMICKYKIINEDDNDHGVFDVYVLPIKPIENITLNFRVGEDFGK